VDDDRRPGERIRQKQIQERGSFRRIIQDGVKLLELVGDQHQAVAARLLEDPLHDLAHPDVSLAESMTELLDLQDAVCLAHAALEERHEPCRQRPVGMSPRTEGGDDPVPLGAQAGDHTGEDHGRLPAPRSAQQAHKGVCSHGIDEGLDDRVPAEEEGGVLLPEREQPTVGAASDRLLAQERPGGDKDIGGDDEGGSCSGLGLGRDHHPGHPVQCVVPDRRTAEARLHPVAGLLQVFDLDPSRRLRPPQDARGPDALAMAGWEAKGPEPMVPEVLGAHQAAGSAGRWGISVQLQSCDVLPGIE